MLNTKNPLDIARYVVTDSFLLGRSFSLKIIGAFSAVILDVTAQLLVARCRLPGKGTARHNSVDSSSAMVSFVAYIRSLKSLT